MCQQSGKLKNGPSVQKESTIKRFKGLRKRIEKMNCLNAFQLRSHISTNPKPFDDASSTQPLAYFQLLPCKRLPDKPAAPHIPQLHTTPGAPHLHQRSLVVKREACSSGCWFISSRRYNRLGLESGSCGDSEARWPRTRRLQLRGEAQGVMRQ